MRDQILTALKWYKMMGIDYYYSQHLQQTQEKVDIKIVNESSWADKVAIARKLADGAKNLAELKQTLMNFDLCELKFGAKNLVFADGNEHSKIMLIGEAPGATEDERGIPFCGISGELLDNMLASIGLFRKQNCYITNTVFWRPPANRQPTAEEVEICKPFLEKHIALIEPSLIVLVGGVAVTSMLGASYQISKIRSHIYKYSNQYIQDIDLTAIFHPAYLIRQPYKKKDAWFDMLQLRNNLKQKNIF